MSSRAIECFEIYKESIFQIDYDLKLWKSFLESNIKDYSKQKDSVINTAIFCAYDHEHNKISGSLKSHKKVYETKISELGDKRIEFFIWIMNLSILKAYNALEILILQAIQSVYYPQLEDPINGKKQTDKVQAEIKEYLKQNGVKLNTKNNKHLIDFLTMNSVKLNSFLNQRMNVDLNTKWLDFFEMISIIRNVVAHCGMILQPDVQNEIKSKAKDIFERHFEIISDLNGLPIISPRENIYGEFIKYLNSLSMSIYKFVFDQNDLTFIGLK